MIPKTTFAVILSILFLIFTLNNANAARKPKIQTGADAEVTHDGLHRVDRTVMDMVWVKPDIDLTGYKKIMLVGAGLAFKEVDAKGTRSYHRRSNQTEFPISEKNRERLRDEVKKAFEKELSKVTRFETTNTPGDDVLLLAGGLIDIVSNVPPEPAGRVDIYLSQVGEATLVLELRDSITNEILIRSADRRAAEVMDGFWIESSSVSNWSEVRRLARSWARLLRKRLAKIATLTDDEEGAP